MAKSTNNTVIVDVETTISNKGNPYDIKNKLCTISYQRKSQEFPVVLDIEYSGEPYRDKLELFQSILDNANILVGFNIKFDLHWLRKYGLNFYHCTIWDCQIFEYLNSQQRNIFPSLSETCEHYKLGSKKNNNLEIFWNSGIDTDKIPWEDLKEYTTNDITLTKALYETQMVLFNQRSDQFKALVRLHMDDIYPLFWSEKSGLNFNTKHSETLAKQTNEELILIDQKLSSRFPGIPINWKSGDHLSSILYGGKFKFPIKEPYTKTLKSGEVKTKERWAKKIIEMPRLIEPLSNTKLKKPGYWSTDEKVLKRLQNYTNKVGDVREIISILLQRSLLSKRLNTYYQALPEFIKKMNWDNNIIHGTLNQCATVTGRPSSSKPNLQNFDTEILDLFPSRFNDNEDDR